MDPQTGNLISVLTIFTLAVISPGPNFVMITRTSLGTSRRSGLFTALGIATGSGLFALAGLTGLLLLITAIPYFTELSRFLGGGYLAWLGLEMLASNRQGLSSCHTSKPGSTQEFRAPTAFRIGLLTNLSNPKAWAFYLSIFTLVLQPGTPLLTRTLLNLAMFAISLAWYALVVLLLSDSRVQSGFIRAQPQIQRGLGLLLIILASRLILA